MHVFCTKFDRLIYLKTTLTQFQPNEMLRPPTAIHLTQNHHSTFKTFSVLNIVMSSKKAYDHSKAI